MAATASLSAALAAAMSSGVIGRMLTRRMARSGTTLVGLPPSIRDGALAVGALALAVLATLAIATTSASGARMDGRWVTTRSGSSCATLAISGAYCARTAGLTGITAPLAANVGGGTKIGGAT